MLTKASLISPDWPAPPSVRAYATTRFGGYSQAPYHSLNLGRHVNDEPALVQKNRQALAEYLGLAPSDFAWLEQVHGAEVYHTDMPRADMKALSTENNVPCADASFSRQQGAVCVVMTADCLPVLFCDKQGRQVAAAHAGWRGLCGGVLERTVAEFERAEDVLAWLGPAIGPNYFEVGAEVRAAFIEQDPAAAEAFTASVGAESSGRGGASSNKYLADLYLLARQRLARAGVTAVYGGGFCTYSDREHSAEGNTGQRFYSYRRDGARSGRMASLIYLR